jgi:hypothetical protein
MFVPVPLPALSHLVESPTVWLDREISSKVLERRVWVTKGRQVDRIEYVSGGIPSIWGKPRTPTAFVTDLSAKEMLVEKQDGKLYTPDALLKDKVQCRLLFGNGS